jgi:hypothetical protein
MTELARLQSWYSRQCDGDWEHGFGIQITTIDNPGWRVTINLEYTDAEGKDFAPVEIEDSDDNWIRIWVSDKKFQGACSPHRLTEVLSSFANWVEYGLK